MAPPAALADRSGLGAGHKKLSKQAEGLQILKGKEGENRKNTMRNRMEQAEDYTSMKGETLGRLLPPNFTQPQLALSEWRWKGSPQGTSACPGAYVRQDRPKCVDQIRDLVLAMVIQCEARQQICKPLSVSLRDKIGNAWWAPDSRLRAELSQMQQSESKEGSPKTHPMRTKLLACTHALPQNV